MSPGASRTTATPLPLLVQNGCPEQFILTYPERTVNIFVASLAAMTHHVPLQSSRDSYYSEIFADDRLPALRGRWPVGRLPRGQSCADRLETDPLVSRGPQSGAGP